MPRRRILSLWFPRLAAERWLRRGGGLAPDPAGAPFAVVAPAGGALVLASLAPGAEAAGLRRGMALADARAIAPGLVSRPADPPREAAFLAALARWAGRFSPWVAVEGDDALALDVTGCAHLFGGEAGLAATAVAEAEAIGLTLRAGLADTLGAAWAVARFAAAAGSSGAGDAIDQEARATRSRAAKRAAASPAGRAAPDPPPEAAAAVPATVPVIVPAGAAREALAPLPVAALRLETEAVAALAGLGLRRIGDLDLLPRAQLARRVGVEVVRRLDQALGREPEPLAATRPGPRLAVRLTLPEAIDRAEDLRAGIARLAAALCDRLRAAGMGARRLRLVLGRIEGGAVTLEVGLARAIDAPEAMASVLDLRLEGIDAGFGFDLMRLLAVAVESCGGGRVGGQGGRGAGGHASGHAGGHAGGWAAEAAARRRLAGGEAADLAALLDRLGARLGLDALVRLQPADSHLPEKATTEMAAAFAPPARPWPRRPPRPPVLFPPEPVTPEDAERPPRAFRCRRRRWQRTAAFGPERIAPEWWLDDPAWRSGARDYWRVETATGERLWLFEAQGGEAAPGWFLHGDFG